MQQTVSLEITSQRTNKMLIILEHRFPRIKKNDSTLCLLKNPLECEVLSSGDPDYQGVLRARACQTEQVNEADLNVAESYKNLRSM